MYDTILFDLDGTIADTQKGIINSLRSAFARFGIEYDGDMTVFIGPSFKTSFPRRLGVDDEKAAQIASFYREKYAEGDMYECRVFNGMRPLLYSLHKSEKKIAVATSKPYVYAESILKRKKLYSYFDAVEGSDPNRGVTEKDQVISMLMEKLGTAGKTVLVGDTIYDYIGAQKTNIDFIGVDFGYGKAELIEAGVTPKNIKELKKLLLE